jgi:hypothetical protein
MEREIEAEMYHELSRDESGDEEARIPQKHRKPELEQFQIPSLGSSNSDDNGEEDQNRGNILHDNGGLNSNTRKGRDANVDDTNPNHNPGGQKRV